VELEVSWKEGEVSALLDLGKGLTYPKNTLMTHSEVSKFIISKAIRLCNYACTF